MSAHADRNLLFGIQALHNGFITRDQLIAAMHAWVLAKDRPLGDLLVEQGALTPSRQQALDALLDEHVKQHDGDAQKSWSTRASSRSTAWAATRTAARSFTDRFSGHRLHALTPAPLRPPVAVADCVGSNGGGMRADASLLADESRVSFRTASGRLAEPEAVN
jgi:hypothetical protein